MKKGHNNGLDVSAGGKEWGDLMMIQGPLALNWSSRKYSVIPRIENSDISERNPGSLERVRLWEGQHIHVKGRPEWIFIKVHCHGGQRRDMDALLGRKAEELLTALEGLFRDQEDCRLHYITGRECYNIIKAAESNEKGNPSKFRDYVIPPPANRSKP